MQGLEKKKLSIGVRVKFLFIESRAVCNLQKKEKNIVKGGVRLI